MPTIQVDPGLTMNYEDDYFGEPWRQPEVALLIHGVAESSRAWFGWVPHLARELRVLRPDQRGFGRSTVPPADFAWSIPQFAADLARFLDAVGVERVHVVGAKLGASIALQFAADFPDRARTLTVSSGPVRMHNSGGTVDLTSVSSRIKSIGVRDWVAETQPSRLGSSAPPEVLEYWTDFMSATDRDVFIGVTGIADKLDLYPVLPRITAPTLVLTTENSPMQSLDRISDWRSHISRSEVVVLPGDSYHPSVTMPDRCATEVLAFIVRSREQAATSRSIA